ncbi:ATP-binding protein [Actibacterium sp. 188UL27-1]|uniref:ATP-binding protein n=1 Tax=Actibacterium sp. 188UL27-1 TaxID=2786961 RepID=UPI00195BAD35|nr:ATP-binding protein [Actibacterium sp. 188UL27-1]MBM7069742.1 ATP-binding protein [Actibacterium sp. 188UL27-1]
MMRWLNIDDVTVVSAARRLARQSALDIGLPQTRAEEIAIVTTEAATNALRHGGGGRILIQKTPLQTGMGLALIVVDDGPGIAHINTAMADGNSSRGSAGLGLGAIRRLSDRFDIWAEAGIGTVVACEFAGPSKDAAPGSLAIAGLTVCHPAETQCGDSWTARTSSSGTDIFLCDGLGHGPCAADAAKQAIEAFETEHGLPADALSRLSRKLNGQRGVVAAAVRFHCNKSALSYGAVGNITTFVIREGETKRFPVRDGRLGGPPLTAYGETFDLCTGDIVVLHSDGLSTVRLSDFKHSLFARSPLTIAATLLHRNFRGRDDASIVVVRPSLLG